MVADPQCQGQSWGYCAPGEPSAVQCHNAPENWRDSAEYTCHDYVRNNWCSPSGGYGRNWQPTFGTFEAYATGGRAANAVCCGCGGGTMTNISGVAAAQGDPYFVVLNGACSVDQSGCVRSPNYPQSYGRNEHCRIVTRGAPALIHVSSFDTEASYDALMVNGYAYSGRTGPEGVIPQGSITWSSDVDQQGPGWKLCFQEGIPAELPQAATQVSAPAPAPAGADNALGGADGASLGSAAGSRAGPATGSPAGDGAPGGADGLSQGGPFPLVKLAGAGLLVSASIAGFCWYRFWRRTSGSAGGGSSYTGKLTPYGRRYVSLDGL